MGKSGGTGNLKLVPPFFQIDKECYRGTNGQPYKR